eukprot:TRINITY_DN11535_c0_g1_i1.p3 TRINITY_DN11535_c0_g1~~TRINITY_DN11535_c0_g1_i1.p3  ORF type:complete len:53 (+),score=9.23 TRINITY_DN11535_c0_g1_i1:330-488(+)
MWSHSPLQMPFVRHELFSSFTISRLIFVVFVYPHVLCVDTGRSSETAKAHRG